MKVAKADIILGGLNRVTVLGKVHCVVDVVGIPQFSDDEELESILLHQPILFASWRRILARAKAKLQKAQDQCDETKHRLFRVFWDALADQEKKDRECKINGDETTQQRRSRTKYEIANGKAYYRRDFSDERVWGFVYSDSAMIDARKQVRRARAEVEVTEAILAGIDHRMRCLTHLAALHRDNRKQ